MSRLRLYAHRFEGLVVAIGPMWHRGKLITWHRPLANLARIYQSGEPTP